jgi:hypothetical protein
VVELETKLREEVMAAAQRERDLAQSDAGRIREAAEKANTREKELLAQYLQKEAKLKEQVMNVPSMMPYVVWSCEPSSWAPMWESRVLRQPWQFLKAFLAVRMGDHGRPPRLILNGVEWFPGICRIFPERCDLIPEFLRNVPSIMPTVPGMMRNVP